MINGAPPAGGSGSLITPQPKAGNYTTVAADGGTALVHPSTDNVARTFTYDMAAIGPGMAVSFVNRSVTALTIASANGVMTLAGGVLTGNRTLAQNGIATAYTDAAGTAIISGTGLT
jgi:hypothetical protein